MLKTKGVFLEGRMGRMRNKRPRKLMEVKYFLKIIIKEKEKKKHGANLGCKVRKIKQGNKEEKQIAKNLRKKK